MTIYNNVSRARFTRVWLDPDLSKKEVAELTGFSFSRSAQNRAKALGLQDKPNESPGRKPKIIDLVLFTKMWNQRVYAAGIARHFQTTLTTVNNTRARAGLSKRPEGRFAGITLDEFLGSQ